MAFGLRLVALGLAYYVSARLGLRLALVDDIVTPLWPPTGVAVVGLSMLGFAAWPAVAVAAFAVNVSLASSPLVAAGIAVGNTLAPLAAAALLRRADFDARLERLRDAVVLVAVALVSMMMSASVGTASVAAGGASLDWGETWWVWWAGDAMGVLIVAPVLWSLARVRRSPPDWSRATEAALLFAALILGSLAAAGSEDGLFFVMLPLVAWVAWRFQQLGAAPAGLIVSTIVILAAVDDRGVFAGDPLHQQMVVLQTFNASVALTSFVFAAAFTERRHILESLYHRERAIAETFQRSMLPDVLPDAPGVVMCGRYIPSSRDALVGGDWYDVIQFADGRLGLVIGDIVGHGVAAASAMAQLRAGVRAHALARQDPGATVAAVNQMSLGLQPDMLATLLYAELDPESHELRFASAGHPLPLLVSRDGQATYLTGGLSPPIGVESAVSPSLATHPVPTLSTLVFFTDGLVERRGEALTIGLERLRTTAGRVSPGEPVAVICERILDGADVADAMDDIALLVVRSTA